VLSDTLKQFLATTYAYTIKAQYFHWNVEGADFGQLHKFFQKIYNDANSAIDPIAEFIRTEEEYTPGSFERFQELSLIPGQIKVPRARLMLEELVADTQTMLSIVAQVFESASQERREDVANFMAERQNAHGKYLWQLKSFLKDQRA
jgi:starvation-inducible DNA-binding protein